LLLKDAYLPESFKDTPTKCAWMLLPLFAVQAKASLSFREGLPTTLVG